MVAVHLPSILLKHTGLYAHVHGEEGGSFLVSFPTNPHGIRKRQASEAEAIGSSSKLW